MKTEQNILIAFVLNMAFSIFELFGGIVTGSIAILSDSVHDFGDALSIGLSYYLEKKSKQKPNKKYTYGYARFSVMGSVITTLILLVGSIFVIAESIKRLFVPVPINYNGMIIIALFGLLVNTVAAHFTHEGDSLNQKAVNLHMLEDVFGWLIVLIGSIFMKFTDVSIIDSLLSMLVALFIFVNAAINMKTVLDIFLEKTPTSVDIEKIKENLVKIKGIKDVHHIHIRTIDGYSNFATLHIVVDKYSKEVKDKAKQELKKQGISHSTIELELENEDCHDELCKVESSEHEYPHHH